MPSEQGDLIVQEDALTALREMQSESVHLTLTSPPYYNARDYAQYPNYRTYLLRLRDVFQEVHRLTKPGRFLVVNTSSVITPRDCRQAQSVRHPIPFDLHALLDANGWGVHG